MQLPKMIQEFLILNPKNMHGSGNLFPENFYFSSFSLYCPGNLYPID